MSNMYIVTKNKKNYDQLYSTLKDARKSQKYLGKGYHIYKTDARYKSKSFGDFRWIKIE